MVVKIQLKAKVSVDKTASKNFKRKFAADTFFTSRAYAGGFK
jgi:hypothetical protein